MKLFNVLIILFIFSSCSFDDKTGIWKNENIIKNNKEGPFKDFKQFLVQKKFLKKNKSR